MKNISLSGGNFFLFEDGELVISFPAGRIVGLESEEVISRARYLWEQSTETVWPMKKVPKKLEREFCEIVELAKAGYGMTSKK